MRYVFYGRNEVVDYSPAILECHGIRIPTLGKWNRFVSYSEFLTKDNISVEIKAGQKISVDGESVHVKDVQYDIVNDIYRVYTEKVVSSKVGNMTEEQAEAELQRILDKRSFFQKLWDRI
jgi:hypothetical protein